MLGLLAISAILDLGVMFLTALFAFLLLQLLAPRGRKSLAVSLFICVLALVSWALVYFATQAVVTLPNVAETTIPSIVAYAQQHGRQLPFTDWDSLRRSAMDTVIQQKLYLTNAASFAQAADRLLVQFLVGCVVAVSVFLNNRINLEDDEPDSLYGLCSQEIAARFRTFLLEEKAGLWLDTPEAVLAGGENGPVVVAGRPEESPLIRALSPEADPHMPPKKQLADAEIASLRDWVAELGTAVPPGCGRRPHGGRRPRIDRRVSRGRLAPARPRPRPASRRPNVSPPGLARPDRPHSDPRRVGGLPGRCRPRQAHCAG